MLVKQKQFLKIQLSYVLIYPILFIVYSLLFNSLKLTTGNILLDVGVLMALTGVSGYLLAFYLHIGYKVRRRRS
jgi:hypothetical protein